MKHLHRRKHVPLWTLLTGSERNVKSVERDKRSYQLTDLTFPALMCITRAIRTPYLSHLCRVESLPVAIIIPLQALTLLHGLIALRECMYISAHTSDSRSSKSWHGEAGFVKIAAPRIVLSKLFFTTRLKGQTVPFRTRRFYRAADWPANLWLDTVIELKGRLP